MIYNCFRNGSDTGFDSCILLNHIPQHTFGNTRTLEATVTLPNVNCQYCALQVIQFLPQDNGGIIYCPINIYYIFNNVSMVYKYIALYIRVLYMDGKR